MEKQDIVFEIPSDMNRKVCVTFFGDRAGDVASFKEGDTANVSVNVESREYNGRWYTDVRGWRVVKNRAPLRFRPPRNRCRRSTNLRCRPLPERKTTTICRSNQTGSRQMLKRPHAPDARIKGFRKLSFLCKMFAE
ncbi:MAG: DUF3127 domain-containing protein [Alistipes putredinis]|nr:MAG: DUF3127 domain-containing protein [Alistipes putredinis]